MAASKRFMNVYLEEVFKRFVAIKDEDIKKSRRVFEAVFEEVLDKMREKSQYFKRYGKEVMYAGSVYDGIKVSKLDEFDMDIVIRLPIYKKDGPNGIILENEQPGYVKMKITNAFDNLDKQKDWEDCHVVTRDWRDEEKYFVQNEFRNWIHGLVQKALNEMGGKVTVGETTYLVTYRESGPAYTLNVRNDVGNEEFILDVDLVPVIKFSLPRWPEGYRQLGHSVCREWLVVPKPNKDLKDQVMKNRCWRLSFQEFEHELMKGCHQLKMTIRLVKKLRDVLGLKAIASYYIKTLFLWEVYENKNKDYWQGKIRNLFLDMVLKLKNAIETKTILYFWNDELNLLANLSTNLQIEYVTKLQRVCICLEADYVDRIVRFLLTEEELYKYQNSDFYKQGIQHNNQPTASSTGSSSPVANSINEPEAQEPIESESEPMPAATKTTLTDHSSMIAQIAGLTALFVACLKGDASKLSYEELKNLKNKYEELEERLWVQEEKLNMMESEIGYQQLFAELSSAFDKVMDNAVKRGLMPALDGETMRWRIGNEDVTYGDLQEFHTIFSNTSTPRRLCLSGTLDNAPCAASNDDVYRPGIGDGGTSTKFKLFKAFLSVITNVGSTDNTGLMAINPK